MKTLALIIATFAILMIFLTPYIGLDISKLRYTLTGCVKEGSTEETKTPLIKEDIDIQVINSTIYYYRAINHQCCKEVTLEKNVNNSIINLTEVWTGEECKCMCSSEINATITGLKKGNYTLNAFSGNDTLARVIINI